MLLFFSFASQYTFRNLFGSLMIIVDKPFCVVDDIVTRSVAGNVQEIGFRSTRLRTCQGSILYVHNAKLADSHIDNYGLKNIHYFIMEITVSYETPFPLISTFVDGLQTIAGNHPLIS